MPTTFQGRNRRRDAERAAAIGAGREALAEISAAGARQGVGARGEDAGIETLLARLESEADRLEQSGADLRVAPQGQDLSALGASRARQPGFQARRDPRATGRNNAIRESLVTSEAGRLALAASDLRDRLSLIARDRGRTSGFGRQNQFIERADSLLGRFGVQTAAQAPSNRTRADTADNDRRQLRRDARVGTQLVANARSIEARRNRQVGATESPLRRRANTLLIPGSSASRPGVLT